MLYLERNATAKATAYRISSGLPGSGVLDEEVLDVLELEGSAAKRKEAAWVSVLPDGGHISSARIAGGAVLVPAAIVTLKHGTVSSAKEVVVCGTATATREYVSGATY